MKINDNGVIREMTEEEIAEMQSIVIPTPPYEQRVVNRIREVYSDNEEYAILRKGLAALYKGDKMSDEFAEYNAFVEKIKAEEKQP